VCSIPPESEAAIDAEITEVTQAAIQAVTQAATLPVTLAQTPVVVLRSLYSGDQILKMEISTNGIEALEVI
jgi:hypothetical protein